MSEFPYEIERFKVGDSTVIISHDECPDNPREGHDHLGTMLYVSDRYILGDERVSSDEIDDITSRDDVIWLPVYAYIHSGVTINTTGFHCPWDSGQCGVIYIEVEDVLKEYSSKTLTDDLRKKVEGVLRAEVEEFDQYLRGEVYGFTVLDEKEQHFDSCWGFYGLEYCREAAKESADGLVEV